MAFVLLKSNPSGTGGSLSSTTTPIAAGNTEIADAVPGGSIAVKWFISIENDNTAENIAYEVYARNAGGDVTWNRTHKLGDPIKHTVDVAVVSGELRLNITNNETTDDITVHAVKILVF